MRFFYGKYRYCIRLEIGRVDLVWWRRGRS